MAIVYAVAIIIGSLTGIGLEKLSAYLINKRVNEPIDHKFSGNIKKTLLWCLTNAVGWFFAVLFGGLTPDTLRFVLLFSACLVLSAVDINIRKIPNEIVLFILLIGFLFEVYNSGFNIIRNNLIGLIAGFAIFFLPAFVGKGAGLGDVKFAAAAGFCLGIYDFLTAVIIMTLTLLIYTVYLVISKKGNLKSKIALGPFMASGFVMVLMINIINVKYTIFDLQMLLSKN